MKMRLSKTFLLCSVVLCMSFYIGASAFAADMDVMNLFVKNDISDDNVIGVEKDELYETINSVLSKEDAVALGRESMLSDSLTDENAEIIEEVINERGKELQKSDAEEKSKQKEEEQFEKMGIVHTNSYVNIRKDKSEKSAAVGKLYDGGFVSILKLEDEWYSVKSGSVSGYVKKDYLITGMDLKPIYKKYLKEIAIIKVENAKIRIDKKDDAKEIITAKKGATYTICKKEGKWFKLKLAKDKFGYVKEEHVQKKLDYEVAISINDEKNILTAEAKAKATEGISSDVDITQGSATSVNATDKELLIALVFSEAGSEPYKGKVAVANVILNRVKNGKYANTIQGVIYAKGQFGPVSNHSLDKNLAKYKSGGFTAANHKDTIKAVEEALGGGNVVGSRTSFNGVSAAGAHENAIVIGNHKFW